MAVDEYGYDLDRAKQAQYAYSHGYYWLPCPICGFETGGHERMGYEIPVEGERGSYHGVCARHPNAENEYVYVRAHAKRLSSDAGGDS